MFSSFRVRCALISRVLAVVGVVILAKLLAHKMGWEILSLNPLFSGIVAANVFLMGFLLSGVLSDYKESERLPGELASSLETIAEEMRAIHKSSGEPKARECVAYLHEFAQDIVEWLYRRHRTQDLLDDLNVLTDYFLAVEKVTQATFLARLKQEQSNIRRILIRIHTVRETSFVLSGYLVADLTTALVGVGLVLARIDPVIESFFFVGVISFLLSFLVLLIRDLDNPFGYCDRWSSEDVSIKPLQDAIVRIGRCCGRDSDPQEGGDAKESDARRSPVVVHPLENRIAL